MMLRRIPPLSLLLLGLAACAADESDATSEAPAEAAETPASEAMASPDVQALEALREEWVTHYNLHHPDMVADLYTPDAVVLAADQGVHEGRDAVAEWLTGTMEDEPTATVATRETMVFGDQATMLGTYQIEATSPEGEALAFSGHYLNILRRVDGEWLLEGSITNYDAPRPEGWSWTEMGEGEEPPAEEGTMPELVEAYETHWNLQHPDMVADLYAENHRADGGWYELRAGEGDEVVQSGGYMLLAERQDDGSWQILWFVNNVRPAAAP